MRFATLGHFGCLAIDGPDAQRFLQGQLTCDVPPIGADSIKLGAHCNPQGRVISLFYLMTTSSGYFLIMPASLITIALNALKKYAVFFKTTLRDASDEYFIQGSLDDLSIKLIAKSTTTEPHDLIAENNWHLANLQRYIPALYPETSGKLLPAELNLIALNAVDFDKGCYTGQEIIARMHYRGKSKNHLVLAKTNSQTKPQPGNDFYRFTNQSFDVAGTIIDVVETQTNQFELLLLTPVTNTQSDKFYLSADHHAEIQLTNQEVNS